MLYRFMLFGALLLCHTLLGTSITHVQLADAGNVIIGIILLGGGALYALKSDGTVTRIGEPKTQNDVRKIIRRTFEENNDR